MTKKLYSPKFKFVVALETFKKTKPLQELASEN